MRRPVAWVVAVVLFVEAFGVAALNWFLGIVVDRQDMSLAGLDPDTMSLSSKIGGIVFGLYYALCGLVALLVAIRNRPAAGFGRVLLISSALLWGLVGWPAFVFMVVVLALIVLLLMTYEAPVQPAGPADTPPADAPGPEGDEGSPVSSPPAPTTP